MKRYKLLEDTPAFKAGTECYIEEAGNMVPCRGISYVIVHKDQLEKDPNILTDWFEEIKESTRWKPKYVEEYYYLSGDGSVGRETFDDEFDIDNDRFEIGNCFKTKEEAERVVEYLKALAVVRGDATSEFVKYNDNWFVCYDPEHKSIDAFCNTYTARNGIFGLPYFATEEDAKRSIELHKKEWQTIFGVKEENEA
jgi:hypothetical protein